MEKSGKKRKKRKSQTIAEIDKESLPILSISNNAEESRHPLQESLTVDTLAPMLITSIN